MFKFTSINLTALLTVVAVTAPSANASLTLLDKDDWKVNFYGFVESDVYVDSTRSLGEIAGNSPVDRPTTFAGDNGRTQFSIRNSRFGFNLLPPKMGEWTSKAVLEFDFFGASGTGGAPNSSATVTTEASLFNNPLLRLRHFYAQVENNGWQLLAGQYWTLFGWEPNYFLVTESIAPVSGMVFQRTAQFTVIKNLELTDTHKISLGMSVTRPAQRDSQIPGIDAGVRWAFSGFKAELSGPYNYSESKPQPLSIGVSGRLNEFLYNGNGTDTSSTTHLLGSAIAFDALVPVIPASDDGRGNTLTLTGEFTTGQGYSEAFTGFSGNLAAYTGAALPTGAGGTNLDAGQLGVDPNNGVQLVHLQTWNAQLQYHLPSCWNTFVNAGYGQLYSNNIDTMTVGLGSKIPYDRSETYFINIFHDFSKQIRGAMEADQFRTTYADGNVNHDNRLVLSAYFFL